MRSFERAAREMRLMRPPQPALREYFHRGLKNAVARIDVRPCAPAFGRPLLRDLPTGAPARAARGVLTIFSAVMPAFPRVRRSLSAALA